MHRPHLSAPFIQVWTNQRLILAEHLTHMINSSVTAARPNTFLECGCWLAVSQGMSGNFSWWGFHVHGILSCDPADQPHWLESNHSSCIQPSYGHSPDSYCFFPYSKTWSIIKQGIPMHKDIKCKYHKGWKHSPYSEHT